MIQINENLFINPQHIYAIEYSKEYDRTYIRIHDPEHCDTYCLFGNQIQVLLSKIEDAHSER